MKLITFSTPVYVFEHIANVKGVHLCAKYH